MGGSSSPAHSDNANNHVLPQPSASLVNEDEEEPPSSGPRQGIPQIIPPIGNGNETSRVVDIQVREKDFATNNGSSNGIAVANIEPDQIKSEVAPEDVGRTIGTGDIEKVEVEKKGKRVRLRRLRQLKLSRTAKIRALFTPRHPIGPTPSYKDSLMAILRYSPLNFLLLFIPVSWALHWTNQNPTIVFVFSGLGIVPLAALLGFGTEQVALRTSQSLGGLLNASLGNLIEMIISGVALKDCELEVVQSALLGSLLSNLLLVLGCAFIVGGFRFHQQQFQPMVAQLNSSLLIVAVISMTIPTAMDQFLGHRLAPGTGLGIILQLSRGSAIVLMLIYIAYLVFQFYSHNHLFLDTVQEYSISSRSSSSSSSDGHSGREGRSSRAATEGLPLPATSPTADTMEFDHRSIISSSSSSSSSRDSAPELPKTNATVAFALLVAITGLAYVTAEHLVSSLQGLTAAHPNISKEWITLIVIPIIGNVAEHTTTVIVASKGKFDLAMSVAVGSCIQIAMFVIPILLLVAWGMGKPLTLLFDPLETLMLFLTVLVVKFSVEDGKSHWMSGIVLISVYVLIATSFWYFPNEGGRLVQGQPLVCT